MHDLVLKYFLTYLFLNDPNEETWKDMPNSIEDITFKWVLVLIHNDGLNGVHVSIRLKIFSRGYIPRC